MGANASSDDFEADDKEVFQSYRIPPKAYKKKTKGTSSTSDTSLKSIHGSTTSLEFNRNNRLLSSSTTTSQQQRQQQSRLRAGSLSSTNQPKRDRPVSHPPSILASSSSSSSLNLSIVNAAVAAGTPSLYGYNTGYTNGQMNSAPLPMTINASTVRSRTNSGYSIGSDSLDLSHVGSGLGRATYVDGKIVELGIRGDYLPQGPSNSLYMHSNYTVQDFMSYQHQQQQQFLEQQQYEYQQMLLLQQQQQQLKQQYQQQQMLLLQQQQKLQSGQIAIPGNRPSQDLTSQVTGVVLQTKTRRPARHPDWVVNGNGHRSNISQSIAIPSNNNNGSSHSLPRQGHVVSSPSAPRVASSSHRSPTTSNSQVIQYGSSPPGSMVSSYTTNGASSFSSTGSHFHTMLAMTSASPPSSSSSSLSNVDNNQSNVHYHQSQHQQHHPSPSSSGTALPSISAGGGGGGGGQTKGSNTMHRSGLSSEELAAKILLPRRVLGGREYYPDKT
ncbi:hypothetical protein BGZ74_011508, partial [Mortierella antarctica]